MHNISLPVDIKNIHTQKILSNNQRYVRAELHFRTI